MHKDLTPEQCRVISVLLEKESTTPDQYPLSLNGLTTGCNQKSNREPVLSLSETEVQRVIDELRDKKLVVEQSGFGSRVVKYKHRFCNTEFGDLRFTDQQRAVVCVLLLRGPQTPGELRTRTQRLADFSSVDEVETVLQSLVDYSSDSLVMQLPREPGKRESRYAHLFAGEPEIDTSSASAHKTASASGVADEQGKLAALEAQVSELQQHVYQLSQRLEAMEKVFG